MNRCDVLQAGATIGLGGIVGVTGCTARRTGSSFQEGFETGIGK